MVKGHDVEERCCSTVYIVDLLDLDWSIGRMVMASCIKGERMEIMVVVGRWRAGWMWQTMEGRRMSKREVGERKYKERDFLLWFQMCKVF